MINHSVSKIPLVGSWIRASLLRPQATISQHRICLFITLNRIVSRCARRQPVLSFQWGQVTMLAFHSWGSSWVGRWSRWEHCVSHHGGGYRSALCCPAERLQHNRGPFNAGVGWRTAPVCLFTHKSIMNYMGWYWHNNDVAHDVNQDESLNYNLTML